MKELMRALMVDVEPGSYKRLSRSFLERLGLAKVDQLPQVSEDERVNYVPKILFPEESIYSESKIENNK